MKLREYRDEDLLYIYAGSGTKYQGRSVLGYLKNKVWTI